MKAKSFFGGTNPKDKATKSEYKGNTGSATGGGINISRKTNVEQVPGHSAGEKNTHKQYRDPNWSTKSL